MEKYVEKLLQYMHEMQFTDIIGIGQILEVEEQDEFIDYVIEICTAFAKQNRKRKRQILKLAKDITVANRHMVPGRRKKEETENGTIEDSTTQDAE